MTISNGTSQKSGQKMAIKWPEKWLEKASQIIKAIANDKTISIAKLEEHLNLGHTTIKNVA